MQYACSASTWRHPGHEPLGGNMGVPLPDFGVASGEAFFFGNSSRNLLSSSSVIPLAASDLCLSLAESDASSSGDRTICGVRKMTSSVLESDRKSTRLNSSHLGISYAVFCLKKKK